MRDKRYDILFEPVKIGPLTTKNRFYQVPHCAGMGHRHPRAAAEMRGIKAEGGWSVISTEEAEIHSSSEISPSQEARIWDEKDIPALQLLTDKIHEHGSFAAIELVHMGMHGSNLYSREVPVAPSDIVVDAITPLQARAMDKQDIANVRRWHRQAAIRAVEAGFDIVYVYAGHGMSLPMHFLSRQYNQRSDEYGGNLENRCRFFKELIEDTREAVGDKAALAVRLAVDELIGSDGIEAEGEGKEILHHLAELPDLWDVNISNWSNDSATARFSEEGFQEPYIGFVKSVTTKPVVGVGRFTSPDTMVSQVKRGILDLIGAARPSIADPFLPKKIEEGRIEDIRECIGCNICVAADNQCVPIRCTQNPTMGEEWRRGWHPEKIAKAHEEQSILVVGAGPAGMEAARALGQRGYDVTLADCHSELGGRLIKDTRLPGLASWGRVRDHRKQQMLHMSNVEIYLESELHVEHILELACDHVVLATGSHWRDDCIGRSSRSKPNGLEGVTLYTPDKLLDAKFSLSQIKQQPVVIFDDDHYYMAGALAEMLVKEGHQVTLVTPQAEASSWTRNTLEQVRIQTHLLKLGVEIIPHKTIHSFENAAVNLKCIYSGNLTAISCANFIPVTERIPDRALYDQLMETKAEWQNTNIKSVELIGDALAPGMIVSAVFQGHRYARQLGEQIDIDETPFKREMPW